MKTGQDNPNIEETPLHRNNPDENSTDDSPWHRVQGRLKRASTLSLGDLPMPTTPWQRYQTPPKREPRTNDRPTVTPEAEPSTTTNYFDTSGSHTSTVLQEANPGQAQSRVHPRSNSLDEMGITTTLRSLAVDGRTVDGQTKTVPDDRSIRSVYPPGHPISIKQEADEQGPYFGLTDLPSVLSLPTPPKPDIHGSESTGGKSHQSDKSIRSVLDLHQYPKATTPLPKPLDDHCSAMTDDDAQVNIKVTSYNDIQPAEFVTWLTRTFTLPPGTRTLLRDVLRISCAETIIGSRLMDGPAYYRLLKEEYDQYRGILAEVKNAWRYIDAMQTNPIWAKQPTWPYTEYLQIREDFLPTDRLYFPTSEHLDFLHLQAKRPKCKSPIPEETEAPPTRRTHQLLSLH